jgi:hypothetical protein
MAVPMYDYYIEYLISIFGVTVALQPVYDPQNAEYGTTMIPIQTVNDPFHNEHYSLEF